MTRPAGAPRTDESPDGDNGSAPGTPRRDSSGAHRRPSRRARRKERRRARRFFVGRHPVLTAFVVVVLALSPVWDSMARALNDPGMGATVPARFAEWVRQNGGGGLVTWAENEWYSHHPPPVGGAPSRGAIPPPPAPGTRTPTFGLPTPHRIRPIASPAIAGEGLWHPVGRLVDGEHAVYEAFMRPDPVHTSVVVGVAWMDTKLLRAALYSSGTIPGGGPFTHQAPIAPGAARTLVAAFNSGFLLSNSNGGYYTDHHTYVPLRDGAASFVVFANGDATVEAWHGAVTANVVAVRQNLDLIVDHGEPVPTLDNGSQEDWGWVVGNSLYVWRSGLGVTEDGALVYVGGPDMTAQSLAEVLVRAGAVRAMELDINTYWVDFATFAPTPRGADADAANGHNLLATMEGSAERYFSTWWKRDFITMSARGSVTRG